MRRWIENEDEEELETTAKWSPEAKCSCRNGGEPYDLQGIMVTSLDPNCRVHKKTISTYPIAASVERIVGNWKDKEKV
jgi:hypothetical protein